MLAESRPKEQEKKIQTAHNCNKTQGFDETNLFLKFLLPSQKLPVLRRVCSACLELCNITV